VKYRIKYNDLVHLDALYKFSDSHNSANSAFQADIGGNFAGASVDAFYSKIDSAITASSLSAAQVAKLPGLYSVSNSLAATISDNTAYALMASYKFDPVKFFGGYEYIRYTNPKQPLSAGFTDIGGYVLAVVSDSAYNTPKDVQVYWTGVRYTVIPNLELTAAYYHVHQEAYGPGTQAGTLEALSFDADYHFNVHFDAYLGAMYSGVDDGLATGYLYTTNINPTVGVRYKF
jgi:predicted porin